MEVGKLLPACREKVELSKAGMILPMAHASEQETFGLACFSVMGLFILCVDHFTDQTHVL